MRVCKGLVVFLALSLKLEAASAADICSRNKCPQGREPIEICFVDPVVYRGVISKADVMTSCGYHTKIVVTKTTDDIGQALEQLSKECKSVKTLRFAGHGDDGFQLAGELDQETVQSLKKYSCVFNKNAEIDYMGCLVGQGCSGDMLLYQTAKSLLSKGGSVTAPTSYSLGFAGIVPHFSTNFKYRKVIYSQSQHPPDKWTQTGLTRNDGGTINERCADELTELEIKLKEAKLSAHRKGCSIEPKRMIVGEKHISDYQKIKSKLSQSPNYLETASSKTWRDLYVALENIKTDIETLENCRPFNTKSIKNSKGVR